MKALGTIVGGHGSRRGPASRGARTRERALDPVAGARAAVARRRVIRRFARRQVWSLDPVGVSRWITDGAGVDLDRCALVGASGLNLISFVVFGALVAAAWQPPLWGLVILSQLLG